MDTRNRIVEKGEGRNPHPYTGRDKTASSQMNPCDTCALYEKEYMEYANSTEDKCSH